MEIAGILPYPYNARTAVSKILIKMTEKLHESNAAIYNHNLQHWQWTLQRPQATLGILNISTNNNQVANLQ